MITLSFYTRISRRYARTALGAVGVAMVASTGFPAGSSAQEGPAVNVPPPAVDEAAKPGTASEVAVIAGGCFWGVQGVFQHVNGVKNAVSGYAGGDKGTARYEAVSSGATGHAEAVSITFDPSVISYGRILQIYFSVAHNPTLLNRQGPDTGTQYRSAIFPATVDQARVAKAYVEQLDKAGVYPAKIATTLEPLKGFYAAEAYHQDFLTLNPSYPYILINDLPKVHNLQRMFPDLYKPEPTLVSSVQSLN